MWVTKSSRPECASCQISLYTSARNAGAPSVIWTVKESPSIASVCYHQYLVQQSYIGTTLSPRELLLMNYCHQNYIQRMTRDLALQLHDAQRSHSALASRYVPIDTFSPALDSARLYKQRVRDSSKFPHRPRPVVCSCWAKTSILLSPSDVNAYLRRARVCGFCRVCGLCDPCGL